MSSLLGLLAGIVLTLAAAFYFWRNKAKLYEQEVENHREVGQRNAIEAATLKERAKAAESLEQQATERERLLDALREDLGTSREKLAQFESSIAERERAFAEQKELLLAAE